MSNLLKRFIAAIILAPLVLYIIVIGGIPFFILSLFAYFIMLYEWFNLTAKAKQRILWFIAGFLYITVACLMLIILERYRLKFTENSTYHLPLVLLGVLLIVWVSDIFAYIFGRLIGGAKLAPKISPNKTWAGVGGAITGTIILFLIINYFTPFKGSDFYLFGGLFIFFSVISIMGDLLESYMKRKFGVKDSGAIIPGHGGLLDRLDGLLLVLNIIAIYVYVSSYEVINSIVVK